VVGAFENFSSGTSAQSDASLALHAAAYEAPERRSASADASNLSSAFRSAPSSDANAGMMTDAGTFAQLRSAIENSNGFNFTTAAENAQNGVQAQFILGADGKLRANPAATPSPDGKVNIQVESPNNSEIEAKKMATEMQKQSIRELVAYFKQWNPRAQVPQHWLDELAKQPDVPSYQRPNEQDVASLRWPDAQTNPQITAPAETPPGDSAPVSRSSGGSPGGFSSGGGVPRGDGPGGSYNVGNANIGSAPESGSRDGSFDSNPTPLGPMDRSAIPPPVAGDLRIKYEGEEPPSKMTGQQVQDFLEKVGSPAANEKVGNERFSDALVRMGKEHHIDPAVALGFFLQESTCGRAGRAVNNHSFGNIKGTSPEGMTDGTFRKYSSWTAGAADWYNLMDKYVNNRGLETLSQAIKVYAPSSDGNNPSRYTSTVVGMVEKYKKENSGVA
jgi:hypothetical protein